MATGVLDDEDDFRVKVYASIQSVIAKTFYYMLSVYTFGFFWLIMIVPKVLHHTNSKIALGGSNLSQNSSQVWTFLCLSLNINKN